MRIALGAAAIAAGIAGFAAGQAAIQTGAVTVEVIDNAYPNGTGHEQINSTGLIGAVSHLIIQDADDDGNVEDGDLVEAVLAALASDHPEIEFPTTHPLYVLEPLDDDERLSGGFAMSFQHLQGDFDLDGDVDSGDVAWVNSNIGLSTGPAGNTVHSTIAYGDVDLDGAVTFADLLQVSSQVGNTVKDETDPVVVTTVAAIEAATALVEACYYCECTGNCGPAQPAAHGATGRLTFDCSSVDCNDGFAMVPHWVIPEANDSPDSHFFTGACCGVAYDADGVMLAGQLYKISGGTCATVKMTCENGEPKITVTICEAVADGGPRSLQRAYWKAARRSIHTRWRKGPPNEFGGGASFTPPVGGGLPSDYPKTPAGKYWQLPGMPLRTGSEGNPCDPNGIKRWVPYFKGTYGYPWNQPGVPDDGDYPNLPNSHT